MNTEDLDEPIIDPDLPIIDAHHHLWLMPEAMLSGMERQSTIAARALTPNFRRHARYLLDEFLVDVNSGHNIRATVFIECRAMYRASGPDPMKSVGEVEFVNGVAAMAASGLFGETKVCAGIVGNADLRMGAAVEDILVAQVAAGGGRYRGIRSGIVFDEDQTILGNVGAANVLLDKGFREGFVRLAKFGLSFDAWLLEPQLPDLIDLAKTFPNTQIIVNHVGGPVAVGRYQGRRDERFPIWRDNIHALARLPNVAVKLGGLGIPFPDFPARGTSSTSLDLAQEWKPYIETCIEAFGVNRCMFESNFPVDAAAGPYRVIWNAFKRIAAGASTTEKVALFAETAKKIYRLDV